jgi:uncharacterized iron-regulated membrane protein
MVATAGGGGTIALVRKLIKLALIALGIRAFLHWRKRRQEARALSPAAEPATDPAVELRRKLAESREDVAADDVEEPPAASVADRRAEVHEQGRSTLDEMKSTDEG